MRFQKIHLSEEERERDIKFEGEEEGEERKQIKKIKLGHKNNRGRDEKEEE